jgi:hypothetical protein
MCYSQEYWKNLKKFLLPAENIYDMKSVLDGMLKEIGKFSLLIIKF